MLRCNAEAWINRRLVHACKRRKGHKGRHLCGDAVNATGYSETYQCLEPWRQGSLTKQEDEYNLVLRETTRAIEEAARHFYRADIFRPVTLNIR